MNEAQEQFFRYCCRDSAVTYEINEKLTPALQPAQLEHYHFNIELLNPLLYMELRGMRYNHELALERLANITDQIHEIQSQLDSHAVALGALETLDWTQPLLPQVQARCCYKKDPSKPKASYVEDWPWILELASRTSGLSSAERGKLAVACDATMNIKSYRKFADFLYKTCKLPTQWKKDPATKEMRVTTDYEALLKLSKSNDSPVLHCALELSRFRSRAQLLSIFPVNGRMLCSYNLVGSETGRVTCSKSAVYATDAKRAGYNLQTMPDDWTVFDSDHPLAQGMRDLFVADEGCYLAKCDLKGADGWTVGAYMAMLGDSTMLDDLKYGLKPAQIVAYILKNGANEIEKHSKDRKALKELAGTIQKEDWEYFVSKQGIWGTCYTMGPRKLAERVFIESEGKVNLTEKQARDFQAAIYVRYRVKLWHQWMQRHLDSQKYPARLVAPNGFTRRFFGRKSEILGEALAHMPQVITTHATLAAVHKSWNDPDNRLATMEGHGCRLRAEPMHFVHDEAVWQIAIEDTSWFISKVKQWFNNPITIAGQTITIPFDGAIGTAWSMDKHHKIMEIA